MHEYTIITDADSVDYQAKSADAAARQYAATDRTLKGVRTARSLVSHVVKRGGFITILQDGVRVMRGGY